MRHLRESQGLSREAFAEYLRTLLNETTSASAINKWERGERAIPGHVEKALLSRIPVELPLEELSRLLEIARQQNLSPKDLISQALSEFARRHIKSSTSKPTT
jgi:transcriptional regulator with XRE-family HTH domain